MADELPERCCGRCRWWSDDDHCLWIDTKPRPALSTQSFSIPMFMRLTPSSGTDCPAFEKLQEEPNDA